MRTYMGRFVTVAILVTVPFLVFAASQKAQNPTFTDAAKYYKDAKCVTCHGATANKKFNTALTDDELVAAVLKGKKGAKPPHMPGYEAKGINAEQAKALVDLMKPLKAPKP